MTLGSAPLVPEFDVTDFARSLDFYVGLAGFAVLYDRPESAFAYLKRDDAEIMIQRMNGSWRTGALDYPFGRGINFEIRVSGIDALHARFMESGYPIFVPMEERWYRAGDLHVGVRQFLVQDPDGYLLRFQEAIGTRSRAP